MKHSALLFSLLFLFFGCENPSGDRETAEGKATVLQEIALANGFENWENISEISYTFNVDRDTSHFERKWVWQPKTGKKKMIMPDDTVSYNNETEMDSTLLKTDGAFINDKYWLLYPYQLVWDTGFTHEIKDSVKSPLAGKPMQQITVSYNDEDGYTPGDTYILYVNENHIIQEWEYKPAGSPDATMATTWEDYKTFEGLNISTLHQNEDGSFKLYFTDIEVETD